VKRQKIGIVANEVLFGQLTSWIANTGFRSTEKPTSAADFMPSQWAKKARAKTNPTAAIRMTKKSRKTLASSIDAVLMTAARRIK
jgi:hypothetical protein